MQKVVHDIGTRRMDVLEMTPQDVTVLLEFRAAFRAEKEAEAQKRTPQKELLAAADAARTVAELRVVVVDLIKLAFGLSPEPEPVVDDGVIQTPQPVEEMPIEEQP